jgi:sucrose-6-phosphate hydrolase SacC (GH32 family)
MTAAGPGNDRCKQHVATQYVFHLSDQTCAINDPNGPFYDEVHGMYHNMYRECPS